MKQSVKSGGEYHLLMDLFRLIYVMQAVMWVCKRRKCLILRDKKLKRLRTTNVQYCSA